MALDVHARGAVIEDIERLDLEGGDLDVRERHDAAVGDARLRRVRTLGDQPSLGRLGAVEHLEEVRKKEKIDRSEINNA